MRSREEGVEEDRPPTHRVIAFRTKEFSLLRFSEMDL